MSSVLKKLSLQDSPVPLKGVCTVQSPSETRAYTACLHDLSPGGMSFFLDLPAFQDQTPIEIHCRLPGHKMITLVGIVISSPSSFPSSSSSPETRHRYSVRFNRKLNVSQFAVLAGAFEWPARSAAG